jgi:hypothetical protein
MPKLALATSTYRRDTGNLPELRLVNMFTERTRASENGVVLQSRPGLSAAYTVGEGPINGIFCESGIFDGDVFVISGNQLYRDGAYIGIITGTGPAKFAGAGQQLAITRGESLHIYDGVTLETVAFPDEEDVEAVETIGSYFYGIRADTQRIYFSSLLNGASWDGLDYISSERKPDPAFDILNTGEELVILGPRTIEFFQETGDADAPIARAQGRSLNVGVLGGGCAAIIDGSLVWVADDHSVRTYDGSARRLSDAAIDGRIRASTTVSGFGWAWEGHVFFAVRLDTETLVVDAATGEWWQASTYGSDNYRVKCAAMVNGVPMFGDSEAGNVAVWSGVTDLGQPLERVFSAASALDRPVTVDNVLVTANVGHTAVLTGQGSDPQMEIRASRDAGNTWGAWRPAPMGSQGQYRTRTKINRWGMFDQPGMIFEGRVTDPIGLRVDSFEVNAIGGGRSR